MSEWDAEYEQSRPHGNASSSSHAFPPSFNRSIPSDFTVPDSGDAAMMEIQEEDPELTILDQLARHWMNERHCPDILPMQEALLTEILNYIKQQSEDVQAIRTDPKDPEKDHLRIMLVQIEIERIKFVVRSYIRTRLYKIEKYARFITQNEQVQEKISESERQHASRHAELTDRHFYSSVLQSLPHDQANLDDSPVLIPSMVSEPDKTRPVFVHALKRCEPMPLPDGTSLEMPKGHISLVPYYVVEHLVVRGDAELV